MKFCTNCGTELKPEAKFCAVCGTPVAVAPPPPAEPTPQPQTIYQQQEPVYEHARQVSSAFKEAVSGKTNLIQRVINILTKPKKEWFVIETEHPVAMNLIGGYVLILALIPALASFVHYAIIGESIFGYTTRSVSTGIQKGIIELITAGLGVYLLAWIIDQLAPSFESGKNFGRSLQLAVYASTPQWIAGILLLLSKSMSLLVMLFALYAIYLFAVGLPVLKKTPKDKVIGYVALTIIAMIIIHLVLATILTAILTLFY